MQAQQEHKNKAVAIYYIIFDQRRKKTEIKKTLFGLMNPYYL